VSNSDPGDELFLLRERAYGPNPTIDAAGVVRLNQLESASSVAPEEVANASSDADNIDVSLPSLTVRLRGDVGSASSSRHHRFVRRLGFAGVAVLTLVAVGWGGFALGQAGAPAGLSASIPSSGSEAAEAAISKIANWDVDSLQLIRKIDDTTLWAATKDAGKHACIGLYTGGAGTVTCDDTDAVRGTNVGGSLVTVTDGGTPEVQFHLFG